jgi:hypothetical protein
MPKQRYTREAQIEGISHFNLKDFYTLYPSASTDVKKKSMMSFYAASSSSMFRWQYSLQTKCIGFSLGLPNPRRMK